MAECAVARSQIKARLAARPGWIRFLKSWGMSADWQVNHYRWIKLVQEPGAGLGVTLEKIPSTTVAQRVVIGRRPVFGATQPM